MKTMEMINDKFVFFKNHEERKQDLDEAVEIANRIISNAQEIKQQNEDIDDELSNISSALEELLADQQLLILQKGEWQNEINQDRSKC